MVPCAYSPPPRPTGSRRAPAPRSSVSRGLVRRGWSSFLQGSSTSASPMPVLGHVPADELHHGPVQLEPARLPVLGVVAHQERFALRMMLTGHLDHRPGPRMAASKSKSAGCSRDRLAGPGSRWTPAASRRPERAWSGRLARTFRVLLRRGDLDRPPPARLRMFTSWNGL